MAVGAAEYLKMLEAGAADKGEAGKKKKLTFEEAVSQLPPFCDDADEIDWIRAHPAMARKARQSALGEAGSVVITADDILNANHGPAPSQSTAYALQHWSNRPEKFYERVLQDQQKGIDNERKREEEVEELDDLEYLDGLIDTIESELIAERVKFDKRRGKKKPGRPPKRAGT